MLIELLTEKYPGMRFWLTQRLTAVLMVVYIVVFVLCFIIKQPFNYQAWLTFNSPWWWRILTGLFFFSLCLHAWIGVRDVFRDYVFNQTLRGYLQTLVELMLLAYLIWLGFILWGI